jgi:hypothetical protein
MQRPPAPMLPGVTDFTNPARFIAPGFIANARLIRRVSSAPGIRLTVSRFQTV